MTKRHSNTSWRSALYNAVRGTPQGVAGAVAWMRDFRGKRVAEGTLYKKLDGSSPSETVTIELAETLTEYVRQSKIEAGVDACQWLKALCARFDLIVIEIDRPPPGGWPDEVAAIQNKAMLASEYLGAMMAELRRALDDMYVNRHEADQVSERINLLVQVLLRLDRNVRRVSKKQETASPDK